MAKKKQKIDPKDIFRVKLNRRDRRRMKHRPKAKPTVLWGAVPNRQIYL
jgi:hypothetical protein